MTSPELISFIKKQKELGVPEANYRAALASQSWKMQDIDEALSSPSFPSQVNNVPLASQGQKGFGLLIATEIIFIFLLMPGFITENKPGPTSSLSDLMSFIGIILIIPGFIIALIGIKDAIVSFKNKMGKGGVILFTSLILLVISVLLAAHLYRISRYFF